MKIHALVAAVALALAGGVAFAQTSGSTPGGATAGGSGTAANTPSTTTSKEASSNATAKAGTHHAKRHHAMRHHKSRHTASASRTDHMGAAGSPQVDLNSGDRQSRMDQAYQDWKSHG